MNMIELLQNEYPNIAFRIGERYSWNPDKNTITYPENTNEVIHLHSLLHELSHAQLEHNNYKNDVQLIKMERDAWSLTKKMLKKHGVDLNHEHIEDCLDTYRDWIYSRAKCPRCYHVGYQSSASSYSCVFCMSNWKVPVSRLCMVKRVLE